VKLIKSVLMSGMVVKWQMIDYNYAQRLRLTACSGIKRTKQSKYNEYGKEK